MGWNDHIDDTLTESLKELITSGFLFEGGAPFDVSKKVIERGKASLMPDEVRVFDEELVPALRALEERKSEAGAAAMVSRPPLAPTVATGSKVD